MPRPKCCRNVDVMPEKTCFRPDGATSWSCPQEVSLSIDEYESLRLADLEGLYQEQAASRMNVSRQTFGRIVEAARRKVADVIVNGKTLRIEGRSGFHTKQETDPMSPLPSCLKPAEWQGWVGMPALQKETVERDYCAKERKE